MKKWAAIVLALCLLVLAGCQEPLEVGPVSEEANVDWGVAMTVKRPTATGCSLEVSQRGGNPTGEVTCGCDFWVELQKDGVWRTLEITKEVCWTMEAYLLSGRTQTFDINWGSLYGALPAGTYRVGKKVLDSRAPGDFDEANHFSQPFIIE